MKAKVISVSDWIAHAPPKTRIYHVTVRTEDERRITFFKGLENAPPENLWEGEEVEVVFRKHKADDLVLPFIV
jgi:hypothetical protein